MKTIREVSGMGPDEFVDQHDRWFHVRKFLMLTVHGWSHEMFYRSVNRTYNFRRGIRAR